MTETADLSTSAAMCGNVVAWKKFNTRVPAANDDENFKKSVVMGTVEKFTNFVNAVIDEKSFKSTNQYINNQKKPKYPFVEQGK